MKKVFLFVLLTLVGCFTESEYHEFVKVHGEDDFVRFAGSAAVFRGADENGNPICLLGIFGSTCETPYAVTIDKNTGDIVKLDSTLRKERCGVSSNSWSNVPIADFMHMFVRLHAFSVKVERDSTVTVQLFEDSQKLIRISSSISAPELKKLGVIKPLGKGWYLTEYD